MEQPRKREREGDSEPTEWASKHHRSWSDSSPPSSPSIQQKEPLLSTPAPAVPSPEQHADSSSQRPQTRYKAGSGACKQPSEAARSEPKRVLHEADREQSVTKRRRQSPSASERQPTKRQVAWFIERWLRETTRSRVLQKKLRSSDVSTVESAEDSNTIPAVEGLPDREAAGDRMAQLQDAEVSERLEMSSAMYRGTLKMNGVIVDNWGTKMPRDVQDLVAKHIRKERESPELEEEEKATVLRKIDVVWDSPEPKVSDIITPPLFPFDNPNLAPSLAQGGEILWSSEPLPRSDDYPLVTPKTDRHLGYQTTPKSKWTGQELAAADHPMIRPYSQPTRENLFPSFLIEVKSESTGGTSYAAEAQLATAGFHRVSSLLWILDQIDPNRSRSSCDAIVFSAAVSQRQAIAHVHYYNPDDDTFYMSFIDSFSYAKNIQGCRNFSRNVEDWLLAIQQPIVRDAMKALHPITQLWKKAGSASAVADDVESSSGCDSGGPTKNRKV